MPEPRNATGAGAALDTATPIADAASARETAIEVRNVVKHYRAPGRGTVHALDDVSVHVERGQVLGIVGESGCGKSTLARLLTRLERPDAGSVEVLGARIDRARRGALRELRRTIQLVFQDPYASLDPRQRVGAALAEALSVHGLPSGDGPVRELLTSVGLPATAAERYPHQLSGGQRQRLGIARALAVRPQVLVLDEPVSALDVSVRAEIVNLLARLREELGLTYVFITHDLGMVRHLADEIAVMYLGKIVEIGPWDAVSDQPLHPYTRALQAAVPIPDPTLDTPVPEGTVVGEVPDAANPPTGCRFHPRCPLAEDLCRTTEPELLPIPTPGAPTDAHRLACHVVRRRLTGAAAGTISGDTPNFGKKAGE
ncbi:ABC transporter ATP-binding protein (plasmid) [Embleya sp. NBC_00888]|uniref:ABC transporter ATP-binding protein n=1 Tax=Embleya sp. NBC_00888 TaxID=2975960 RepID=UPI002F9146F7|nr:ABC transporter ATP-binding protein [Embleya sp. NBC_00888]